jgi:ribonuclease Z
MQFDTGRGTVMRLADVGLLPQDKAAVFVTHIHSDHVEGLSDLVQIRWMYGPDRPKLDVLCPADAAAAGGSYTASRKTLVTHIDDANELSGETAVRIEEMPGLDPGGAVARLNVLSFENRTEPRVVWQSGDVTVSAAIHPALSPEALSGMPEAVHYRQSNATDIGAMAARAGVGTVMLTHLGPALGAATQGPWVIPGGPLDAADFEQAVRDGGFAGDIVAGTDLATVRLVAGQ